MKLLAAAIVLMVASITAHADAPAKPQRLALVIGNAAYKDSPLANPLNDAADMAKALQASGFTVIRRENATLREMHLALREFGDRLGRQSTGLFYFAGHGMQVKGRNFLIPVDAEIAREDEVAFTALDLGAVMEKLDSARNPVNIVVLDACRNNPFGNKLTASAKGLAQVDAPPGTLIAFATAPGSTAADGGGRNGLYTQHLVKQVQRPGAAVEEVFKAVRASVRSDSKGAQVPWESTSLESAFRFREPPAPKVETARASPAASPASAMPASLRAPPLFKVGDSWTYRMVNLLDQSERQSVQRIGDIRGEEVRYVNGAVGDAFGNYTRIVRSETRADEYSPSTHHYVFPLKTGESYRFSVVQTTPDRVYDLDERIVVGPEEEVDTPHGKVRGIRIEREIHWKQRDRDFAGVDRWVYWYNSAIKKHVLAEQTNTTATGKVLAKTRQELVTYSVK